MQNVTVPEERISSVYSQDGAFYVNYRKSKPANKKIIQFIKLIVDMINALLNGIKISVEKMKMFVQTIFSKLRNAQKNGIKKYLDDIKRITNNQFRTMKNNIKNTKKRLLKKLKNSRKYKEERFRKKFLEQSQTFRNNFGNSRDQMMNSINRFKKGSRRGAYFADVINFQRDLTENYQNLYDNMNRFGNNFENNIQKYSEYLNNKYAKKK
jgi:Fe2+ transport system protein B